MVGPGAGEAATEIIAVNKFRPRSSQRRERYIRLGWRGTNSRRAKNGAPHHGGLVYIQRGGISPAIFFNQVINISAVAFGERRAFDEQNVFGIELCAAREVV